jgi:hypothetical protein
MDLSRLAQQSEPEFLTVDDVLWTHEQQRSNSCFTAANRESAIAHRSSRPSGCLSNVRRQDLPTMAAAYAFHIAQNQLSSTARSVRRLPRVWLPWISGIIAVGPEDNV